MKQVFLSLAVVSTLQFFSTTVSAQTPTAVVADTTKKDAPLVIAGYADVYYRANANSKGSYTSFTTADNAFSLASANVQISKETEKFAFMADLFFGERADQTAYNYVGAASPFGTVGSSLSFLKQLYVVYKPTKTVKLTAGEFTTFFGYELIESPSNLNYSTSYTFSNGPFYHTGVKADFTLSDKLTATLGIFDPTDTKGFNGHKYVGGQLGYTEGTFKAFVNVLTGTTADSASSQVTTFDVTSSWQATTKFGLGFNFTNKGLSPTKGTSTNWWGSAVYVNYVFSDNFTLAARGEIFDDGKGLAGLGTKVNEFTVSGNFKAESFTFIPEIRFDNANAAIFGNKTSDVSLLCAAIYKF